MNAPLPPAALLTCLYPGPEGEATLPIRFRPEGAQALETLVFATTEDGWRATVRLPDLPAGALVVPSLILGEQLPGAYALRFLWGEGDDGIDLAPIEVQSNADLEAPKAHMNPVTIAGATATGGLDCVATGTALPAPRLEVRGNGNAPTDAVLLVSVRARHITVRDDGATAGELAVPGLSQMARPAEIARHVCSPLSVAMVLAAAGRPVDPEAFARSCEHPHHGKLFGMWPLNLARARREGFGGLVRIFERVDEIAHLLDAGVPIVASIRFEAGRLPGAPLPRTGGHLVVLRGLGEETVLVNDPAAPSDDAVARRYDRAPFLEAWLADRGVGYLLWPLDANGSGGQ